MVISLMANLKLNHQTEYISHLHLQCNLFSPSGQKSMVHTIPLILQHATSYFGIIFSKQLTKGIMDNCCDSTDNIGNWMSNVMFSKLLQINKDQLPLIV